jgi:hypothetical protein
VGEQGSLQQHGAPALLIQASGERGPTASEAVSEERLEALGRAALSSVDALDGAQDLESATQSSLLVQRKTFPEWALRLLVAALLAAPLLTAVDALARVRRRGIAVARWTIWTLTCALPFAACALFLRVLGGSGALPVAPTVPLPPAGLELDATSAAAIAAAASTLTLGWLLWPALVRRVGLRVAPDHEAAGVIALLVLLCAAVVVWAVNPFAALLIVPAAHAWLLLASPELRPRRGPALALVALGLLPLLALIAFYADALGLGVGKLLWSGALLFAGGHIGIAGSLVWAVVLGCAAAMTMVALREPPALREPEIDEEVQITMRGPLGYAGPGSLGGTESALRR